MELELVEPSLYLRIDAWAPERFADAVAIATRVSLGPRPAGSAPRARPC